MPLAIGQRVRHPDTGELGVVVWAWHSSEIDAEDTYVAFFGTKWPTGGQVTRPYILRYAASSLELVDATG